MRVEALACICMLVGVNTSANSPLHYGSIKSETIFFKSSRFPPILWIALSLDTTTTYIICLYENAQYLLS